MIPLRNKRQQLSSLSDEELVSRYTTSQERSFLGELYSRYSSLVYGVCLKYLNDRNEAQDAMMDIFADLVNKLPKQEDIRSFRQWLYQVAKHECFSRLRDTKKMPIGSLDEENFENNPDHFMENEGFLRLINEQDRENTEQIVMDAIARLKPEQSACVTAFYLEELSYKEIAHKLDYPLLKVKSYIQNGKRNLKAILMDTQIRT